MSWSGRQRSPSHLALCSLLPAGVPTETFSGERRVALTPAGARKLLDSGFHAVVVQRGAGALASFSVRDLAGLVVGRCSAAPAHVPAFRYVVNMCWWRAVAAAWMRSQKTQCEVERHEQQPAVPFAPEKGGKESFPC